MRIGIDVGGTFTDLIGIDDRGRLTVRKTTTTPQDPSEGVLTGVDKLLRAAGGRPRLIVHGTTIGTNALLERKGVKTGLLTTAGFRDVLEIGRVQRPAAGLYDFNVDNPEPLVPRALRLEAVERVGSDGAVVTPLDEDSVRRAAAVFRQEDVRSVAVSFLFSFLKPDHERRAREILQSELPDLFVSLSSDVCPEFREFERTSTVVVSAYLAPIVEGYVERLSQRLEERYPQTELRLIQANGGAMRASAAKGRAVNLVNSGPAGGATAAAFLARLTGESHVVSVDMGGTSFDITPIAEGLAHVTTESKFDGFPIKIAMDDVNVIGAGGGSIAWIDRGGALNVGPQSASAMPGPVCYGRGGEEPTVTDANVVLGRISPDYFLGGEIKLQKDRAAEAIRKRLGEPLRLSLEQAAHGILRVVNANMARGISCCTVQRGYDLREFSLMAFGGAGPLHAVDLAEELDMKRVIVPPFPGAFSAFGLLVADTRHDFAKTIMLKETDVDPARLTKIFLELERRGQAELDEDGIGERDRKILWSADLRFEGQSYELNVPVTRKTRLTDLDVKRILDEFNRLHERIYAFKAVDEKSVFVNVRVTAIGLSPEIRPPKPARGGAPAKDALKGLRRVCFDGTGFAESRIYERNRLKAGNVIEGPAVVEEEISCTVVPPRTSLRVDAIGNLLIDAGARR
ncbi:MAG: hydantoinase/oxoprolinase family protein [Planctomycetes bacterium]|nr:hydantoinase/oxoprolinase family protein [Planctomycetota bacterium]